MIVWRHLLLSAIRAFIVAHWKGRKKDSKIPKCSGKYHMITAESSNKTQQ